jgi:hypothetical protein
LISVHFPTALYGSFGENLKSHFGDFLTLDYSHDPVHAAAVEAGVSLPPGQSAVHGHFRGDRYIGAPRITFLREPVSALIAIYVYWRNATVSSDALHARFLDEKPDIFTFAHYPKIRTLMSETYFGGVDLAAFEFVGFHERRVVDLVRLSERLSIPFDTAGPFDEESTGHESIRVMEEDSLLVAKLRDIIIHDVRFYDLQRQRWS